MVGMQLTRNLVRPGLRLMGVLVALLRLPLPALGQQQAAEPCTYNAAHTIANCSFQQLEVVPYRLHKQILTLDISGNRFPTLHNQSFISYPYLNILDLKNNSIATIEAKAFHRLGFLNTLDLSNNKLTHVPALALEAVAGTLKTLVLAGNKIQVLPRNIFQNFSSLVLLDLSGNSINRVDPDAFKGLFKLEELKIRHNVLSYLPENSFDDFPRVRKVQLYDNRWFCDCKLQGLRKWLNKTDSSVWEAPGYKIRCDGPSNVKDKTLDSLSLDELACEVQMKTSSSTRELPKGANTTLLCKYSSVPEAEAKWHKNSETIEVNKNPYKYSVEDQVIKGYRGEITQQSELRIRDFNYQDIAKYACVVENSRGRVATEYRLTLEGVPFDSVTPAQSVDQTSSSVVDTRSVVIAAAVVCGIILVVVVGVLIFCSVNRVMRKRQAKQQAIVENVKQHFINSEASVNNGDVPTQNETKLNRSMENKTDFPPGEDNRSNSNTSDSNMTAVKRPLDLDETEPLYIFEQLESPFTNGNTYVSFSSELTDPGEFSAPPPQYTRNPSSRYESSHAGSATPLLDRYTPSLFDSDEPIEDYAHYPVYDSLTQTLQHPHPDAIYRTGSTSGYSSYRSTDAANRLSGFHNLNNVNGSMPQTSTRSTMALTPRYTNAELEVSSRQDLYYPSPHQTDYQDYQDAPYPMTTPPPHRMTAATKKSMSVGNLGFAPMSLGPKKPPRLFQSREYMELTPQEAAVDYITSHEAQRYSQNYGITPGTPV